MGASASNYTIKWVTNTHILLEDMSGYYSLVENVQNETSE